MQLNDSILAKKIQKKSYSSFLQLYNKYWDELHDMVFARTNNKEVTEEILQNIWVRVWEEEDFLHFDTHGNAAGFLFRYAHYRIKDYYRSLKSNVFIEDIDENLFEISDSEYFETLDEQTTKSLMQAINEVVKTMTPTEQKVYELRVDKRLSVSETAEVLGMSNKTVSNHLSKTLSEIRLKLLPQYKFSKKMIAILMYLEIISG